MMIISKITMVLGFLLAITAIHKGLNPIYMWLAGMITLGGAAVFIVAVATSAARTRRIIQKMDFIRTYEVKTPGVPENKAFKFKEKGGSLVYVLIAVTESDARGRLNTLLKENNIQSTTGRGQLTEASFYLVKP